MALLLPLMCSEFRPAILDANDKSGILLGALGPALLVGSVEEIGWTGFAVRAAVGAANQWRLSRQPLRTNRV